MCLSNFAEVFFFNLIQFGIGKSGSNNQKLYLSESNASNNKLGSKCESETGGGSGGILSCLNSSPVPDRNMKRRDAAL